MTEAPSVLGLSEAQLQHFQTAFKLSYHLNYWQVCQQFVPLRGLDVLEVGRALPASLVIDHFSRNSWITVKASTNEQENSGDKK